MTLPPVTPEPFPHLVTDHLFPDALLREVAREFPNPADERWRRYGNAKELKYEGPPEMWGDSTRLYFELASELAEDIGRAFGIPDLTMETIGGGYHLIPPGGRLAVHTDFNRSPDTRRYRRINFLTYLNPQWLDAGGWLQLGVGESRKLVCPEFGRSVLFEASDVSWHGHPVPTERRWRLSVAAYFFSSEPPPGFVDEHSTVWSETDA